ncbi:uncharacterized protein EV154DRAFT_487736 [Mucor mucedo]|uniref:uncharacterized protein n=1 Tax=Mucor mucedo TaxID=29922 RepID=UPI0022207AB1|nr:uncharacterized protein EV154DRAFT_487736 [Mucor mucedo]KAI7870893.1 hypothetical protein EV154DRAFT_487736 [Mucor mucedo]
MVDWSLVDASKCLVDIGINFYAEAKFGNPAITLVKADNCDSLGNLFAGSSAKTKLMNMTLGTFAGIKAVNASPASRYASKVLIYNDIKYPFTLGNVGYNGSICGEWNAEEMRKKFRHYTGRHQRNLRWYNDRITEIKNNQFTTRLEVRVPATLATPDYYSELTSKLKSAVADDAFIHLDSRVYLEYVGLYMNAISELAEPCLGSVLLESLSGLNLAAYMLNSLMHLLCFIEDAFVLVGETIVFDHTFDMARMQKVFTDAKIVDIPAMDYIAAENDGNVAAFFGAGQGDSAANIASTIECMISNSDPNVHKLVSRRSTWFEFPAITFGPLRVYSEYFIGSLIPVEGAFFQRSLFLYDITRLSPVKNGFDACGVETLGFTGDHTKLVASAVHLLSSFEPITIVERLSFLLPLPEKEKCQPAIVRAELGKWMKGKGVDLYWSRFGTRAWYLELFGNPLISYDHLAKFHSLLMVGSLFLCKWIPTSTKSKMYRKDRRGLCARKASRFQEPIPNVNPLIFWSMEKEAINDRNETSSETSVSIMYRRNA